jgi:predicted RNA binding protein YcfA (HicA-like mRNA interferase family)
MSQKFPRVDPDDVIKVLRNLGFVLVRQSGSHMIYKKGEQRITIPYHSGQTLHPKVLKSIIKDSGIPEPEFLKRLR